MSLKMSYAKEVVLFYLLVWNLFLSESISNFDGRKNYIISEEDSRAAEKITDGNKTSKETLGKSETQKRGVYLYSGGRERHHSYPADPVAKFLGGFGMTGYGQDYENPTGPDYYYGSEYGHDDHGYPNFGGGHHHTGVGNHGGFNHKALALKGILIPLAGIALLGAAAALTTNPVLLQLGVVNGRRRRRAPDQRYYPTNHLLRPN